MKEKFVKALEFIAVIAAILINTVVVRNISVKSILKGMMYIRKEYFTVLMISGMKNIREGF